MPSNPNRFMRLAAVAASLLTAGEALAQAADPGPEASDGLVIRNVAIVDTSDGAIAPGMAVVLRDGLIERIAENDAISPDAAIEEIDGGGRYVVPGYLDMHAHAVMPSSEAANYWRLMIANGVTGFRQMSGSAQMISLARTINTASGAGEMDAPEILQIPGELYRGQAPTAEAAVEFVRAQHDAGADIIKLLGGPREGVLAAIGEAGRLGLDVAGHLPESITTLEAVEAGWGTIEHMGGGLGFVLDCADAAAAIRERLAARPSAAPVFSPNFLFNPILYTGNAVAPAYRAILSTYSEDRCRQLAGLFREQGVWHVPTLIRLRTMHFGADPGYRADANLQYLDTRNRAVWQEMGAEFEETIAPEISATLEDYYDMQRELVGLMKEEGVAMLAGSDLGGIWILPGFGLHLEFHELAAAGLSPLEVLQATTLNAARFLGREGTMGSVQAGRKADLVLLDANPIEDVANLAEIGGVVLNGKHFSREALEAMKAEVAEAYAD